jgi:hypothetical protein
MYICPTCNSEMDSTNDCPICSTGTFSKISLYTHTRITTVKRELRKIVDEIAKGCSIVNMGDVFFVYYKSLSFDEEKLPKQYDEFKIFSQYVGKQKEKKCLI